MLAVAFGADAAWALLAEKGTITRKGISPCGGSAWMLDGVSTTNGAVGVTSDVTSGVISSVGAAGETLTVMEVVAVTLAALVAVRLKMSVPVKLTGAV